MKKRITTIFILVIALISVFSLASCGPTEDPGKDPGSSEDYKVVDVYLNGVSEAEGISVPRDKVDEIDYKQYFAINADGNLLEVKDEYIDKSQVKPVIGTYKVTCTFKDKSAELTVRVNRSTFEEKVVITSYLKNDTDTCTDETWEEVLKPRLKNRFTIKDYRTNKDGDIIKVTDDMIDYSEVNPSVAGTYKVYCTYSDYSEDSAIKGETTKFIYIVITNVQYSITVKQPEITINVSRVEKINFADYFTVTREGKEYAITADMLESNVQATPGDYTVVCRKNAFFATLTVHVTDAHDVEIGKAYDELRLTKDEVATHDFTKDFWVYVDEEAVEVQAEWIDTSKLGGSLEENALYNVTLTYDNAGTAVTKILTVRIIPAGEVIVNARNEETYPNSDYIDLTSLFTITDGGASVPVTSDMVSGSVNYTNEGTNTITLTYKGKQYTATVTVRVGAIVKLAKGESVTIRRGTDKNAYDFASDFIVIINGKRYREIKQYIDVTSVDFTTAGNYEVTVKVPYNSKGIPAVGDVPFDYVEKTVTYTVVDKDYSGSVIDSEVTIKKGESYNLFKNLSVYINGYEQNFDEDPSHVGALTCYAEIVKGKDIDFNVPGVYEVEINVYLDGANSTYHTLSYTLIINSDVVITGTAGSAVVGKSVYLPNLFKITDGGEEVAVTVDMIVGEVDFFTPGVYTVTVTYNGFKGHATVTVFDDKFIGTYKTKLKTIAVASNEDDEGYVTPGVDSETIGDLTIDENMNITVHGLPATDIVGIDANTFTFYLRNNKHTLYFNDGIAVIVPENEVRMRYSDDKRSLIYFNTNVWTIPTNSYFALNSRTSHIVESDYAGYSIDCTAVIRKGEKTRQWYAFKTQMTKGTGVYTSDYFYDVTWGWIDFNDGGSLAHGINDIGTVQKATFDGQRLSFSVTALTAGKIDTDYTDTSYYGTTFTGSIDGLNYTLAFTSGGWPSLKKGTETVFAFNSSNMTGIKFGGYDFSDGTYTVYGSIVQDTAGGRYDYYSNFSKINDHNVAFIPFSYKFKLDITNKKFTYVKKDDVFGLYKTDGSYVFFDGYGNGLISFDTNSYVVTAFEYEVVNSDVAITYVGTDGSFKYGNGAEFYVDVWKNIVTVKRSDGGIDVGVSLENVNIESGAIVRVGDLRIVVPVKADGTLDQTTAKADLLSRFTIITKDGELTGSDKTSAIKTSYVSFKSEGFYQVSVTLTVNGKKVTNLYSVQVIIADKETEASPFYGKFTGAIPENTTTFAMDGGKMVTLNYAGTTYTGLADLGTETLIAYVYSETGRKLLVKGSVVSDNVIRITATGADIVNAYLTTGTATYAGIDGFIVRSVKTAKGTDFFLGTLTEALGDVVTVTNYAGSGTATLEAGSVLKVTDKNGVDTVVRVDKLGDYKAGLTLADGPLGSYTSGEHVFTPDGFGKATYDGVSGTYTVIDDNSVLFKYTSGANAGLITRIVVTANGGFTDEGSPLAVTDIVGNYTATITIYDSEAEEIYTDTITFGFNADGTVKITYVCDKTNAYAVTPAYAGATAAADKVTLRGDELTVAATKNGTEYTFKFTVTDPLTRTELKLTECPDLDDSELSAGKTFVK
mgnify:CR=1 FL=1